MKKKLVVLSVLFAATVFGAAHASDAVFPHRAKFKHVPVLEAETLRKDLDKVIVIDVRSPYEYATLHIKGALHIALRASQRQAADRSHGVARQIGRANGVLLQRPQLQEVL